MLNTNAPETWIGKRIVAAVLLTFLVSCDSGKPDEEIFAVYTNNMSYSSLVSTLNAYSSKNAYHVTSETLTGRAPANTAHHIMLEGKGIRVLVQSALTEKCKEREGDRDVEYSQKVFDVNVFSTRLLVPNPKLGVGVSSLKYYLTSSGFRIVSKPEICDLL